MNQTLRISAHVSLGTITSIEKEICGRGLNNIERICYSHVNSHRRFGEFKENGQVLY